MSRRRQNAAGQAALGIALSAVLLAAGPARAQIVPFADVAGYKVAKLPTQHLCFAAVELRSAADHPMIYSYFQTLAGQRWHVASYGSSAELSDGAVEVEVSIDGQVTLARTTEARDGDFMLPFEAVAEIEGHEALIPTGETMRISVNGEDHLLVDLQDHRAALGAIQACLNAL